MAILIHEIWQEVGESGMVLHTCCLAGVMGEGCRSTVAPNARLLTTFEAGSHFEAMTIYNRFLGREAYSTDQSWDYEPYPAEWRERQVDHA
jgi:hypothetical protein